MRSEKLARVRELPLFAAMSDEGFENLVAGAYLQQFPPATVLIEEGERPDFLYVCVEGAVELYAAHPRPAEHDRHRPPGDQLSSPPRRFRTNPI